MILERKKKIKNFQIKIRSIFRDKDKKMEKKIKLGDLDPDDSDFLVIKIVEENLNSL